MARLAIISDVHANLEAFRAVVEAIARVDVDRVVCLGDVVGYGPDPGACVDLALDACDAIVLGNHEEAALARIASPRLNANARLSTDFTREALGESRMRAIASWPRRITVDGVALTHASFGPEAHEYLYSVGAASRSLAGFFEPFGAVGHTHVPCAFAIEGAPGASASAPPAIRACRPTGDATIALPAAGRCLLNPGSVGQPRDGDPRAAWGLLDTDSRTFDIRRVAYDAQAVAHKIRRAGLPTRLGERLLLGA